LETQITQTCTLAVPERALAVQPVASLPTGTGWLDFSVDVPALAPPPTARPEGQDTEAVPAPVALVIV
jgi:hypothetical protein